MSGFFMGLAAFYQVSFLVIMFAFFGSEFSWISPYTALSMQELVQVMGSASFHYSQVHIVNCWLGTFS